MVTRGRTPFLFLAIACFSVACGSSQQGETGFTEYRRGLEAKYADGMDALASANYADARRIFQELSGESGYVKESVLAKLRLGDTLLAEGDYQAAEYMYEEFISQYRGDPNEPYAHFRKCQTQDAQIPSDFFILPPPESKDMDHARRAYTCFQGFLTSFPDSRFEPHARQRYREVRGMMIRHERYVLDFYWRHDRYPAVARRARGLLDSYPEAADEDVYYRLVFSLGESKDLTGATRYYREYASRYPGGRFVGDLGELLDELRRGGSNAEQDPQSDG